MGMALDFAAMLAHERRRTKELAEKDASSQKCTQGDTLEGVRPEQPHQLRSSFGDLRYLADFLSPDEARQLERDILTQHRATEWLALPKRRLLNLGGVPHPDGMIAEPLPSWLDAVWRRLQQVGAFPQDIVPDQVLLNRYDTNDGIDPHADGPLFEPHVAIISLQSESLLQFLEPSNDLKGDVHPGARLAATWGDLDPAAATVLLQPRSLFFFLVKHTRTICMAYLQAVKQTLANTSMVVV